MRRLRGFFIHVGIICSFVCVIAGALDWYNPYMDFSGHAFFMYLLLCFSVISAAFLGKTEKRAAVCGKKGFEQRIVQIRQQNRGGIREEKPLERVSASDERKADKEKIKDLEIKKKAMEEELDELKGNTAKGKAACVLAFFASLGLLLGIFVGIAKLDIGGVSSEVLAPVIEDVPVLRSILPAKLQKKSASELEAEQRKAKEEQAAEAAAEEAEEEAEAEEAAAEAEEEQAQAEAEAEEAEAEAEEAEAKAEAEAEEEQAEAEAEAKAALQDYVDTYSAMKPKDAAKVFDSMMPDQEDLIVRILENLTSDQRAAILSKMSIANAASLTEKMMQKK